jgi:wyosine [tRNA(Phe)-imidazoG37] synthetase (radical SAM superfamily)
MSHLFGPVPSRRLGRSLGVDLIPSKTCAFDCIYCEVGPTTHKTGRRREYHTESIIRELSQYLSQGGAELDVITLAGSGEPTVNLGLGRIIERLKEMTQTPVAVLTNGALFNLPEVRRELLAADIVLPSLDAAREETFQRINRPLANFTLAQLQAGLKTFRREYRGQFWLEIMLLKGINDSEEELALLSQELRDLAPDRVQLNTAVRPVVEESARPLTREEMAGIAGYLPGEVEVIASFGGGPAPCASCDDTNFLEMLARRPMTARDLAQVLGLDLNQVQVRLKRLRQSGRISCDFYQDQDFYRSQP